MNVSQPPLPPKYKRTPGLEPGYTFSAKDLLSPNWPKGAQSSQPTSQVNSGQPGRL